MIAAFMGTGAAPPANQGAAASVGVEDQIQQKRQLLAGLLGGIGGSGTAKTSNGATGIAGLLGGGGTKSNGPPEARAPGYPPDGAGPFTADVDGSSAGTVEAAMQKATVVQNVPGLGVQGISLATHTDFQLKVQMPPGLTCEATVAGAPKSQQECRYNITCPYGIASTQTQHVQ
ncbi:hypothetical protein ACEQ8H_008843 [Pleosporales sp. CAS-2024a]